MNLKAAFSDFFAGVRARSPRMDAVQFVRRYSARSRQMSHYRVYGRQYASVRRLVDLLGLAEGTDYSIVRSDYDRDTVQFRWSNTPKVNDMLTRLSSLSSRQVDLLSVGVSAEKPAEEILSDVGDLGDIDEPQPQATVAEAHAVRDKLFDRTVAAVRSFIATCEGDDDNSGFYHHAGNADEEKNLPLVLDVGAVEMIVHAVPALWDSFAHSMPDADRDFCLFSCNTPGKIVLTRLLRKGETVPIADRIMDTVVKDLDGGGDQVGTPVRGYMATEASWFDSEKCADRVAAFVRTDGGLYSSVRVLERASDLKWLATYVKTLYETVYAGMKVDIVKGLRLACCDINSQFAGAASPSTRQALRNALSRAGLCYGANNSFVMAELVIREDDDGVVPPGTGYLDIESVPSGKAFSVTDQTPEVADTAFESTNLGRGEYTGEWFCVTHGINMFLGSNGPYIKLPQREENVPAYRSWLKSLTPAKQAKFSEFSPPSPVADTLSGKYSPASAFCGAVLAGLKSRLLPLPLKAGAAAEYGDGTGCHEDGRAITAVYSGIETDNSPTEPNDCLAEFPVFESAPFLNFKPDFAKFTAEARKKVTKLIAKVNRLGLQTVRAKRTKGSNFTHTVIVETNVDAEEFFARADNVENLTSDIARSFIRTVVMRNSDPLCSINDETRAADYSFAHHSNLVAALSHDTYEWVSGDSDTSPEWESAFKQPFVRPAPCWDFGANQGVLVHYSVDSLGRLLVIVRVRGNLALYARMATRLEHGLPVKSAQYRQRHDAQPDVARADGSVLYCPEGQEWVDYAHIEAWKILAGTPAFETPAQTCSEATVVRDRPSYGIAMRGTRVSMYGGATSPVSREFLLGRPETALYSDCPL